MRCKELAIFVALRSCFLPSSSWKQFTTKIWNETIRNLKASAYHETCLCSVFGGMTELCKTCFPSELERAQEELRNPKFRRPSRTRNGSCNVGQDEQVEEEKEKEQ